MNNSNIFNSPIFILTISIWTLIWKGLSLYKAASHQKSFFIILLVLNTVGIFEILYFFYLYRYDLDKKINFLIKKIKTITS
jgi:cytochrome bd-type quinol oxidase subunit 2